MTEFEFARPRADGYLPKAPAADGTWVPIADAMKAGPTAQATAHWYYSVGLAVGRLQGRRERLDEQEEERHATVMDRAMESVHRAASVPPRDELEERRYPGELGRRRAQDIRDGWLRTGLRGGAA